MGAVSESQERGKQVATASLFMEWLYYSLQVSLFVYAYLLWTYTRSKLIAVLIISFTTTVPWIFMMSVINFLCLVSEYLRKKYPSAATDAFQRTVKFFSASLMFLHAKIIHGFEVHGKENLPKTTGGLLVYYHALVPFDAFYIGCEQHLLGRTPLTGIINRQLVNVMKGLCEAFDIHSERNRLVECLKKGYHCSVAPGGGLEGTFSKDYELVWNGRIGFAEVAKECEVPIIPMFTANSQQSMPVTTFGFYEYFLDTYKKTKKYPFVPIICFPAKLRTYLGKPLFCGPDETPADFAERVKAAIYELRDKHQRQPGSIILAILERFGYNVHSSRRDSSRRRM